MIQDVTRKSYAVLELSDYCLQQHQQHITNKTLEYQSNIAITTAHTVMDKSHQQHLTAVELSRCRKMNAFKVVWCYSATTTNSKTAN